MNPDNPHAAAEQPFDVFMLPHGLDIFTATPASVRHLVVAAKYPGEVAWHDEIRRRSATHYVLEAVPSGTPSPLLRQIYANARRAADDAGRREWEQGGTAGLVRGIVGSRPLGG